MSKNSSHLQPSKCNCFVPLPILTNFKSTLLGAVSVLCKIMIEQFDFLNFCRAILAFFFVNTFTNNFIFFLLRVRISKEQMFSATVLIPIRYTSTPLQSTFLEDIKQAKRSGFSQGPCPCTLGPQYNTIIIFGPMISQSEATKRSGPAKEIGRAHV